MGSSKGEKEDELDNQLIVDFTKSLMLKRKWDGNDKLIEGPATPMDSPLHLEMMHNRDQAQQEKGMSKSLRGNEEIPTISLMAEEAGLIKFPPSQ